MSKTVALVLVLVFLIASCTVALKPVWASADTVENSWASKTPMQEARAHLGVAAVYGRLYAIGGDIGPETGSVMTGDGFSGQVVGTNEEYNPATDRWSLKEAMPTARALFGIAVYQNKIYCIGGYYATFTYKDGALYKTEYFNTGANEVYDPATNTWETKSSMPVPSAYADSRPTKANVANGKIYLIGNGVNNVYDPTADSWTTKTPPPYQITSYASAVIDDEIWFIGTSTNSSGLPTEPFFQIYNPQTDSWTKGANCPTYGSTAATAATTGTNAPKRIYIFEETTTCSYDPANNSWTNSTAMPAARIISTVAVIHDIFYVVGGRSGQHGIITLMSPSAVNEQYVPIGYGTSEPTPPPSPAPTQTEPTYAIVAGVAVIAVITVTTVALKKKHHKSTN